MGIYLAIFVVLIVGALGLLLLNDTLKRLKHIDEAPYPEKEAIKQPFRAPFLPEIKYARNDSGWYTRTFERPRKRK